MPRPIKRELVGHDVHHVVDMSWSSKRNGELLRLMVSGRFEALLTVDRTWSSNRIFARPALVWFW